MVVNYDSSLRRVVRLWPHSSCSETVRVSPYFLLSYLLPFPYTCARVQSRYPMSLITVVIRIARFVLYVFPLAPFLFFEDLTTILLLVRIHH